ncbi:MAG: hypothetical protein ACP5HS_11475 [Anaerolineae bacterium]
MEYQTEILRFKEGARSRHPSPEATLAAAQPNVLTDAGNQIAVLVDLTPPLPYRSREIRSLVVKAYWASSGSIVARLRRALSAANRHLVDFNQEATSGDKCSGSITCAVFSDDEVFLGQVGAAYAYIVHPPTSDEQYLGEPAFEIFPKRDRLLIPLGGTLPPVTHIGYTVMRPGSVACLATTQIAEAQAREAWQHVLGLSKLNLISSQLVREFGGRKISGSVVLMRAEASPVPKPAPWAHSHPVGRGAPVVTEEPEPAEKPAMLRPITPSQVKTLREDPREEASDEAASTKETEASSATQAPSAIAAEEEPAEASRAAILRPHGTSRPPEDSPSISSEETAPKQTARAKRKLPKIPIRSWMAAAGQWWERRQAIREERKQQQKTAATTSERARLRQALRTLLPGTVASTSKPSRTAPKERPSLLGGIALGLLLIVTLVTLTKYLQFGGPAKAEELMTELQDLRARAYREQADDPDIWSDVLTLATQITRLDPENTEAEEIRAEAQQAVDIHEGTTLLQMLPLLDLGTAPIPRRILVTDGWIYILNTATDAVLALPLGEDPLSASSESPVVILQRGEEYLGEVANHLVDIAWVPPGGSYLDGAVFIYSEGGTLFIYEPALGPGSITAQRIEGDLKPGSVTVMETFGEKAYLIQRQMNQILLYEPVNGIYETPRLYFAEGAAPDLHLAQEMAIDGRVYLLMGDGTIRTYFAGSYDYSFEIDDLPEGDFSPIVMAIERDPDVGNVYLVDTQRERIVVVNKRGDFVRQYRFRKGELEQVEALAINEDLNVLYLIAKNQLYAAPLPNYGTEPATTP